MAEAKEMSGAASQRTLFQAWGAPAAQSRARVTSPLAQPLGGQGGQASSSSTGGPARTEARSPPREEEHDDDLMLVAVTEAERGLQRDQDQDQDKRLRGGAPGATGRPAPCPPSAGETHPDVPGFDSSAAEVWVYPTNHPVREYQVRLSEAALRHNTLVCLPTGLGKTFIAAVVMYNFYRWYPSGKIVFLAPTKPLVAQQIEACFKVMGIPQAHMAELTGSTAAKDRPGVWRTKRVFFLTPQVMVNDLSRESCPAQQVKCVVIDEAHKALGNHAYCQVIRQLCSRTLQFRILALSATPGADTKAVQAVISNLLISHIELRSEESPDIRAYSHQRSVEKVVVPVGGTLSAYQARYLQVLQKFMSRLVQNRVMAHKDLRTLSKYQIILARDQFRKNPPPCIKSPQRGMLEGDFAISISLYHGYELLMQMGLRSLFFYVQGIMDGSKEMFRTRNELQRTPVFMDLYHEMQAMFVKPSSGPDEPFIYSHPKLEKLEEVVLQHFRQWAESSADNKGPQEFSTRVMIFSSFRESVLEIAAMLNRHVPLIRVMTFMGQASTGKGVKGFTQKEQQEVVSRFRQGGFNTLVSTCVGEEGLDIGDVDLIVCFDAQNSPIRLVQRMGRTGRKRQGRIVIILAEGREERTYNQSQSNKRSVDKSITSNKRGFHMYPNSPRMLPGGLNPTMHKMHIICGQFDHQESSRRSVRGRQSHSEGRASLIHPQNLIRQGSAASDGFLSSTEYSLWASTMRLEEDEALPTLKPSRFMSLPSDLAPQEDVSKSGPLSKDLSLWEWRHWQHKALPTHGVDHSLRCHHFIKVMELIDGMREEDEGECRYEQELLPYLHKAEAVGHVKNIQKKQKGTKTCTKTTKIKTRPPPSTLSDVEYFDGEEDQENTRGKNKVPTFTEAKKTLLVAHTEVSYDDITDHLGSEAVCPFPSNNDTHDDCAIIDEAIVGEAVKYDKTSKIDEDVELQAMFYLPKWDAAPPPSFAKLPGRDGSLEVILANVAELLSRSPPSPTLDLLADMAAPSLPPSPQWPHPSFQVSFTLEVDDNDDDVMMSDANDAPMRADSDQPLSPVKPHHEQRGSVAENSPSWDDVFGEDEMNDDQDVRHNNMVTDDGIYKEEGVGDGAEKYKEVNIEKDDNTEDEVGNEEMPDFTHGGGVQDDQGFHCGAQMDESMDLFGDDEAFLQMTMPDVSTPGATSRTSATSGDIADGTTKMSDASHTFTPTNPRSTAHAAESRRSLNTEDVPHTKHTARTPHARLTSRADATETKRTSAPSKPVPDRSMTDEVPTAQFDSSHDYYSVNFDLGYSLEDSDEAEDEAVPAACTVTSPQPKKPADSAASFPASSNSSTPNCCFPRQRKPGQSSESKMSTPDVPSEHRKRETPALPSPITSPGVVAGLTGPRPLSLFPSSKRRRLEDSPPHPVDSDSEEEVVVHKRRHQKKVQPLSSPDVPKTPRDVDSPYPASTLKRRRAAAPNASDEMEREAVSGDDFQSGSVFPGSAAAYGAERKNVQHGKAQRPKRKGHEFLDGEAALSEEEGADVSSDEEDGEELNCSLDGFVVDNGHLSQGLDESEMHGIYMKSVKSPAVLGKFKMSYRNHHNMDIFSQVPEMDETYAEDSFVVGSEVESGEDDAEEIELMPEESYVEGRRQYATRRRVFLLKARAKITAGAPAERKDGVKTKRARVIRPEDSSEEEMEEVGRKRSLAAEAGVAVSLQPEAGQPEPGGLQQRPSSSSSSSSLTVASKVSLLSKAHRCSVGEDQQKERCRQRLENQHFPSELDSIEPGLPLSSKKQPQVQAAVASVSGPQTSTAQDSVGPAPPAPVCILVDSRCISRGVELMTSLRQRHAATVHVCSLDGSYFIVSNRTAVERHSQSDLAAMQNRKRLAERVSSLQGLFERVCLIVEKDRVKPGESSRPFQRTRYYDSTLTALVRTGMRLLWSDGADQSAGLLADLARLEQRKGQGIAVPLEVKGQHRQQALQFYLSLPSVGYTHALSMSHNFSSVAQFINSSIEAIQKGGCMSRSRAEDIYRFLRYRCDAVFMNASKAGKTS